MFGSKYPPDTAISISPSDEPLHETLNPLKSFLVTIILKAVGEFKVKVWETEQLFSSFTTTV